MLLHLPSIGKKFLSYNYCIETGNIPEDWRNTLIHTILRKDKNTNQQDSFRPKNRLECYLESKKCCPAYQVDFRRGRGGLR